MSFDEEHLEEHFLCQLEVAERDERIRELECIVATQELVLQRFDRKCDELKAALRWARDGLVIHAKGAPAYVSRIDAALASQSDREA
jgi:hypothetical protein